MSEYTQVEKPAIDQFIKLGYEYISGEELAPDATAHERSSWREVVLVDRLRSALVRINPWLSPENLGKVIHDLVFATKLRIARGNA